MASTNLDSPRWSLDEYENSHVICKVQSRRIIVQSKSEIGNEPRDAGVMSRITYQACSRVWADAEEEQLSSKRGVTRLFLNGIQVLSQYGDCPRFGEDICWVSVTWGHHRNHKNMRSQSYVPDETHWDATMWSRVTFSLLSVIYSLHLENAHTAADDKNQPS